VKEEVSWLLGGQSIEKGKGGEGREGGRGRIAREQCLVSLISLILLKISESIL
jgi:hypothetical protein